MIPTGKDLRAALGEDKPLLLRARRALARVKKARLAVRAHFDALRDIEDDDAYWEASKRSDQAFSLVAYAFSALKAIPAAVARLPELVKEVKRAEKAAVPARKVLAAYDAVPFVEAVIGESARISSSSLLTRLIHAVHPVGWCDPLLKAGAVEKLGLATWREMGLPKKSNTREAIRRLGLSTWKQMMKESVEQDLQETRELVQSLTRSGLRNLVDRAFYTKCYLDNWPRVEDLIEQSICLAANAIKLVRCAHA